MAKPKRYYWIKLKESFMSSDTIDYFMSQPGGANYVVLYQMLCLKTINTGGCLVSKIGEMLIPYDVEKIQRECKWFSLASPASRSPPPTALSVRWRWVMPPTARSRKVSDGGLHDGENVQTAQVRPAPC